MYAQESEDNAGIVGELMRTIGGSLFSMLLAIDTERIQA